MKHMKKYCITRKNIYHPKDSNEEQISESMSYKNQRINLEYYLWPDVAKVVGLSFFLGCASTATFLRLP